VHDYVGRYEDAKRVVQDDRPTDQFVFARLVYNGVEPFYIKNWYTDWPKADRQLIAGIQRLSSVSIADHERVVALDDPRLFEYPFLYTSEPGQIVFTPSDAAILREYLERGGLWIVDDFWGSFEWNNFQRQVAKVFPDGEIEDIPRDHPIFHCFFDIDEIVQVPSLDYVNTGVVVEQDGFEPYLRGIRDRETGRFIVIINHNTDLGDAYEHADHPFYPHIFSGFAYRMAMNFIIYALTS
jgi:hypothetical protein